MDFGDTDEDGTAMARVFAAHAALDLSGAATTTQMVAALSSRDLIGQAKGSLMERFRLSPDAAFAVLVRTSSHQAADGLRGALRQQGFASGMRHLPDFYPGPGPANDGPVAGGDSA